MSNRDSIIYGLVVAAAIFFVGFATGLGGSLLPNLGFSILCGIFAMYLMRGLTTYMNRKRDPGGPNDG